MGRILSWLIVGAAVFVVLREGHKYVGRANEAGWLEGWEKGYLAAQERARGFVIRTHRKQVEP